MAWTTKASFPGSGYIVHGKIWCTRPGKWIFSQDSGVSSRTDDFATYTSALVGVNNIEFSGVCSDRASWYGTRGNGTKLYKSTDGLVGAAWEETFSISSDKVIVGFDDGAIVARGGTLGATLYKSYDSGATWVTLGSTGIDYPVIDIEGSVWAAAKSQYPFVKKFAVSTDAGVTWKSVTTPYFVTSIAVVNGAVFAGSDGYASVQRSLSPYSSASTIGGGTSGNRSFVAGNFGRLWVAVRSASNENSHTVSYSANPQGSATYTSFGTVVSDYNEPVLFARDNVELWGVGRVDLNPLPYEWLSITDMSVDDAAVAEDQLDAGPGPMIEEISDTASAQEEIQDEWFFTIIDHALASDDVESAYQSPVISDSLAASDAFVTQVSMSVQDQVATFDSTASGGGTDTVSDSAVVTDSSSGTATTTEVVGDGSLAADALFQAERGDDIQDQASATDGVSLGFEGLVSDSLKASDTMLGASVVSGGVIDDQARSTDFFVSSVASVQTVEDEVLAIDTLFYKDASRVAWVLNTESGAASWYSNYSFNAIAQIGDKVFAVSDAGLFLLDGDADAGDPIDASVQWGLTEFGGYDDRGNPKPSEQTKRHASYHFGYKSNGVLGVEVRTYGENNGPYTYEMPPRLADNPRAGRVTPGKGMSGRYWQVAVHNIDGADFTVSSVSADVMKSGRRI